MVGVGRHLLWAEHYSTKSGMGDMLMNWTLDFWLGNHAAPESFKIPDLEIDWNTTEASRAANGNAFQCCTR